MFRIINKTRDVPYCDTYGIEEEWYLASPSATAQCCVLQVSSVCNFYKFSMVEGLIRNEAEKDTMTSLIAFKKHLSYKGLDFAEKEKPHELNRAKL